MINAKTLPLVWIFLGAAYGLAMRGIFGYLSHSQAFPVVSVVSFAFTLGTPFVIGAIVIYGLRNANPSVIQMIFVPWIAIALALTGSAVTLLEGAVCIILAAPVLLVGSSIGGLIMGLSLRFSNKSSAPLNSILALPLVLMVVEPSVPQQPRLMEDRVCVEVSATPHRIWSEILNARNIRKEELPFSFTHLIGVPRPVEGVNMMTPDGEMRFSKWERGVTFSARVTQRFDDRSITWLYNFTPDSFPDGSLDEHVKIGGQYFDLYDTTFNLTPESENLTRLEIISHYKVTTDVNFYAVPVARFVAKDFMSTIVHLYKSRSERSAG